MVITVFNVLINMLNVLMLQQELYVKEIIDHLQLLIAHVMMDIMMT